jgi:hypothetical protein
MSACIVLTTNSTGLPGCAWWGSAISAIARIAGRSRSTITRSLERAADAAKRFNDAPLRAFEIKELQADELCTFIAAKTHAASVFTTIEVSSRLWPACGDPRDPPPGLI